GSGGGDAVLSQIYDFGRTLHRVLSRRHAAAAASQDEEAQRAFVALNVVRAYDETLLARRLLELARQNERARYVTLKQATANFRLGLVSRVDESLARSLLASARAAVVATRNDLRLSYVVL